VSLTLRQILALQPLRRAEPVVLCGHEQLDRPVRWVHSSEIAEIAPLLKGGELLLTTGLGLEGAAPSERARYIADLAERDVRGVAFEVGRSFETVPEDMVDAARAADLPLIALGAVVPFIEITEEVHMQLMDALAGELRRGDQVSRMLNEALLAGAGVSGLTEMTARLLQAPVVLATSAGRVAAMAGWTGAEEPEEALLHAEHRAEIRVHDDVWGHLHVAAAPGTPAAAVELVLDRAAATIGLELMREGSGGSALERCRSELVADLLTARSLTRTELVVRAGLAGFHPPPGRRLASVALGFENLADGLGTLDAALDRLGQDALTAAVDGDVFAVVPLRDDADPPAAAERLRRTIENLTRNRRPPVAFVAVAPATDFDGIGRNLREAQLTLKLARRMHLNRRVVTAGSVTIERLLALVPEERELEFLVEELLGPLLRYDEERGTELIHTLETYLRRQGSVARAARELYVRRQTLYSRLKRIETLTGADVEDAERRASLLVALKARAYLEGHP